MTRFKVTGMCCAEETALLRKSIGERMGYQDRIRFDLLKGEMILDAVLDESELLRVKDGVAKTGMTAELVTPESPVVKQSEKPHRNPFFFSTLISGIFVVVGILLSQIPFTFSEYLANGAYVVAIIAGFRLVLPRAWVALRSFRPDMNLLMTLAVIGALILNEWVEGGVISFLFALSLLLESWSLGRARNAIAALMESAPQIARKVIGGGEYEEVDPTSVSIGDMLLVKPGERFPVDGRVAAGSSSVDQASVTGESVPVEKRFADPVYAGTVSLDGALEIVATRKAENSTFARIIRMVEDAGSRRSRSEQWVERFARIYTPSILILATLLILIPPLFLGGEWVEWFYRGLVVLVIGCPCALVISTPVSIVAGLASAARQGVLIKGGEYLEVPSRIRAIAFDKTGTLTRGEPRISQ
ncbi:MAG: heavy metal translocating P-type ATPase, partial [Candidatus Kapaibacterium sp.]